MKKTIVFGSIFLFTAFAFYFYIYAGKSNLNNETTMLSNENIVGGDLVSFPMKTFPDLTDKKEKMKFIWLDSSNVIFSSCLENAAKDCKLFGLISWNTDDNTFKTLYESEYNYRLYCQEGNDILMMVNKEKYKISISDSADIKMIPQEEGVHEFSPGLRCFSATRPEQLNGHSFVVLRPNDGYVDMGLVSEYDPDQFIELVSEDFGSRVKLNITRKEAGLAVVTYIPSQEAYFLYDINPSSEELISWRQGENADVWFIKNNGETRKVSVPSGPWVENYGDKQILPVKNGLLIISTGFSDKEGLNPGPAGMYFMSDDKKVTKILTGFVSMPSVSPDGCKVVFNFRKDFSQNAIVKSEFVNVCDK